MSTFTQWSHSPDQEVIKNRMVVAAAQVMDERTNGVRAGNHWALNYWAKQAEAAFAAAGVDDLLALVDAVSALTEDGCPNPVRTNGSRVWRRCGACGFCAVDDVLEWILPHDEDAL